MSLISRSPFGLRVDESPRDDAEARAFLSLAAALVGLVFVSLWAARAWFRTYPYATESRMS